MAVGCVSGGSGTVVLVRLAVGDWAGVVDGAEAGADEVAEGSGESGADEPVVVGWPLAPGVDVDSVVVGVVVGDSVGVVVGIVVGTCRCTSVRGTQV
jgi:hypothetical protein